MLANRGKVNTGEYTFWTDLREAWAGRVKKHPQHSPGMFATGIRGLQKMCFRVLTTESVYPPTTDVRLLLPFALWPDSMFSFLRGGGHGAVGTEEEGRQASRGQGRRPGLYYAPATSGTDRAPCRGGHAAAGQPHRGASLFPALMTPSTCWSSPALRVSRSRSPKLAADSSISVIYLEGHH